MDTNFWAGLLIIQSRKVLMVRESKEDYFKLPGGRLLPNETKEQALLRECAEEISEKPKNVSLVYTFNIPSKENNSTLTCYIFDGTIDNPQATGDISGICWLDSKFEEEEGKKVGNIVKIHLFPILKERNLID